MVNTGKRYSIVQVRQMMVDLEHYIDQTEETLGNEEGKDYPNGERLEALEARRDALQAAYDSLAEIE